MGIIKNRRCIKKRISVAGLETKKFRPSIISFTANISDVYTIEFTTRPNKLHYTRMNEEGFMRITPIDGIQIIMMAIIS